MARKPKRIVFVADELDADEAAQLEKLQKQIKERKERVDPRAEIIADALQAIKEKNPHFTIPREGFLVTPGRGRVVVTLADKAATEAHLRAPKAGKR